MITKWVFYCHISYVLRFNEILMLFEQSESNARLDTKTPIIHPDWSLGEKIYCAAINDMGNDVHELLKKASTAEDVNWQDEVSSAAN